jgi:hypothetical protein
MLFLLISKRLARGFNYSTTKKRKNQTQLSKRLLFRKLKITREARKHWPKEERLPEGSRGELIEGLYGALGVVLLVVAGGEVQPKGGQLIAPEHARQKLVERDVLHLHIKRFFRLREMKSI